MAATTQSIREIGVQIKNEIRPEAVTNQMEGQQFIDIADVVDNAVTGTNLLGEIADIATIKSEITTPSKGDTYKADDTGHYWKYNDVISGTNPYDPNKWVDIGEIIPSNTAPKTDLDGNKVVYGTGSGLINTDAVGKLSIITNSEYIYALVDANNTILFGIRYDRSIFYAGIYDLDYIDPRIFGAVYDGLTDCSPAINRALAYGVKVRFIKDKKSIALCKSPLMIIADNTTIEIDNGFTVKLDNQVNLPLIRTNSALYIYNDSRVNTRRIKNIAIRGGILDFNGANQTRPTGDTRLLYSSGMQIADVDNFIFERCTMKNPNAFGFQGGGLHVFNINNIHCDYDNSRYNMDGIHLHGDCRDGVIEHITGTTNDDFVALNADDGLESLLRRGNMQRITIRDIQCTANGYRGIRLLNNDTQLFDEILIDGVYGNYRYEAVLISSFRDVSAKFGRITLKNINCQNVDGNLIWINNQSSPCEIDSLIIDGINFKQNNPSHITPIMRVDPLSTINKCIINNAIIDTSDIDLNENVFTGNGYVKDIIMCNIYVETPATKLPYLYFFTIRFDNLLVCNAIIKTNTVYNILKNNSNIKESNALLSATTIVNDNGYTYTRN